MLSCTCTTLNSKCLSAWLYFLYKYVCSHVQPLFVCMYSLYFNPIGTCWSCIEWVPEERGLDTYQQKLMVSFFYVSSVVFTHFEPTRNPLCSQLHSILASSHNWMKYVDQRLIGMSKTQCCLLANKSWEFLMFDFKKKFVSICVIASEL